MDIYLMKTDDMNSNRYSIWFFSFVNLAFYIYFYQIEGFIFELLLDKNQFKI